MAWELTSERRQMSGDRWQWDTLGAGIIRINRQIDAWVAEARPAAVAS
jgi:hypothetical protein